MKYIKTPYYCKKCKVIWLVPMPESSIQDFNFLNLIFIFLGVGLWTSDYDLYCPHCHTHLKFIKKRKLYKYKGIPRRI